MAQPLGRGPREAEEARQVCAGCPGWLAGARFPGFPPTWNRSSDRQPLKPHPNLRESQCWAGLLVKGMGVGTALLWVGVAAHTPSLRGWVHALQIHFHLPQQPLCGQGAARPGSAVDIQTGRTTPWLTVKIQGFRVWFILGVPCLPTTHPQPPCLARPYAAP